jgi:hypothetical protein
MKKIISVIFAIIFVVPFITFAAKDPMPAYCEHQGYKIDWGTYLKNGTGDVFCVFDDTNKCIMSDFYFGSCGSEFKKDFSCRQKDELIFSGFEKCCNGLTSYITPGVLGQPSCQPILKAYIGNIFLNPISWITIVIMIIALVTFWMLKRKI